MRIKVWVALNLVGCERRGEIEVEDDFSEEEIEEAARDWMYEHIEWGWEK